MKNADSPLMPDGMAQMAALALRQVDMRMSEAGFCFLPYDRGPLVIAEELGLPEPSLEEVKALYDQLEFTPMAERDIPATTKVSQVSSRGVIDRLLGRGAA